MDRLRKLIDYCKERHPEIDVRATEDNLQHVETVFLPHLLRVLKKDNTLLSEVELFPGVVMGQRWNGTDEAWSLLHMTLLYAVLRGDPKEKFGSVLETLKGLIPGGIPGAADLENMLNSEENQSSLKDIMELVMKTRLASLVGDVIQSLQYTDLDIDFEDPEKLMEMVRDPMNHPVLKEIMDRAQMILKEKIETGKINQQDLRREIETIRAKFQSAFGKYLNEAIVGAPGNTTGNTGEQILSNHPEARRARMLARMQKKQREGGGGPAPTAEADAEAARRADAIAEELLRDEEAETARAKARAAVAQKKQLEKQLRK